MKKVAWLSGLIVLLATTAGCQTPRHVSVQVVGEDRSPIPEATVNVRFLGQGHRDEETKSGLSDESGRFEAHGVPKLTIFVYADKEGYYRTITEDMSRKEDHDVTLVLREKKNPTSLYSKNATLFFPVNRAWVKYDFLVGDWLPPYGKGEVADVQLRCNTKMTDDWSGAGTLEMKFPDGGGLVVEQKAYLPNSEMKLPHEAPVDGYISLLTRTENSIGNKNRLGDSGYFFRTRIKKRGEEVVSAHYGKISEDFEFMPVFAHLLAKHWNRPESYATLSFTYYFNPTPNDRNLEFDLSKNLMKGLESTERVHDP